MSHISGMRLLKSAPSEHSCVVAVFGSGVSLCGQGEGVIEACIVNETGVVQAGR